MLTVYTSYHEDNLLSQYNIPEGIREEQGIEINYIPFPTHKTPELNNINNLNPVLSEMVTMWYVWANNIQSDYIGFQHYRRQFKNIRLPEKNECQIYTTFTLQPYSHYCACHRKEDMDLTIEILNEMYGKDNEYTKEIMSGDTMTGNCCFIMKWNDFTKLCSFMFPVLFELDKRFGCNLKLNKYKERYNNDAYQTRVLSFIAERLISAYIKTNLTYYVR